VFLYSTALWLQYSINELLHYYILVSLSIFLTKFIYIVITLELFSTLFYVYKANSVNCFKECKAYLNRPNCSSVGLTKIINHIEIHVNIERS